MNIWDEKEAKRLFQKQPFYNVLLMKPKIKDLNNTDLLHKYPFYHLLSIKEISKAFERYAGSYKI